MEIEKDKGSGPYRYIKIHVCQASYGDCLALEFDDQASIAPSLGIHPVESTTKDNDQGKLLAREKKGKSAMSIEKGKDTTMEEEKQGKKKDPKVKLVQDPKLESYREKGKTRKVILIDGGPGNYQIHGTRAPPTTPLANLYAMLNTLLPVGSPNTLDTLVITHDDADHINGIHQVMMSMADTSDKGNAEFSFARGLEALEKNKPPFDKIWYNSPTLLFKDDEAKGWFDRDMEALQKEWKKIKMPLCNEEFGLIKDENPSFCKVIGGEDAKTSLFKGATKRGRLQFEFLSPNHNQVHNLRRLYREGKKKPKTSKEDKVDEPAKSGKASGKSKDSSRGGKNSTGSKNSRGSRGSKGGTVRTLTEDDDTEDEKPKKGKGKGKESKAEKAQKKKALQQYLQGVEYNGLPAAMGRDPIYSSTGVAEEVHLSEEHRKLIAESITGNPNDSSPKNQSSLVFVVKDDASKFSAAFTGDGNATASFLQIWDGRTIRYDVLKIMHHGSQHNNCWSASKVNRRIKTLGNKFVKQEAFIETNKVQWKKVPKISVKDKQIQPTNFFLNVLAKKYIISSAATEGHRNPHLSTLAGIITRAIVRKEPDGIDIYITSQALTEQIEGFILNFCEQPTGLETKLKAAYNEDVVRIALGLQSEESEPKLFWDKDGSYYRIWQLRPNIDPKFGTIMLDPWEHDSSCNPAWQRVSFTDSFWTQFHQQHYTTGVRLTVAAVARRDSAQKGEKGKKEKKEKEKIGKRQHIKPPVEPPKGKRGRKKHNTERNASDDETMALQADEFVFPDLSVSNSQLSIMKTSTDPRSTKSQIDIQLDQALKQAVGAEGLLFPDTFTRFEIKVLQLISEGLTAFKRSKTKVLKGIDAFIDDLASRGWLLPDQVTGLRTEYIHNNRLIFGGLISIMLDTSLQISFFSLLPITLARKALFTTSPHYWPVSDDFEFTIDDQSMRRGTDYNVFKSISFGVKPLEQYQKWNIPFGLPNGGRGFWEVQVLSELRFVIYRPFELGRRYIYGCFLGKLCSGQDASNVIVDYLWFPDTESGVEYHIRYANNEFVADGYKMTLKDLWSTIPRGITTINALAASIMLPGKDSFIKIGDYLSIHDCGFVVEKTSAIVHDLQLKSIFGTTSFNDEKSFKPFGDIITLRLPTFRLQIENLFSISPLKVFVRIQEMLSIKDVLVPIVFETRRSRGGDRTIYQLSYIASAGQGLKVAQILEWLSVGNIDFSAIPELSELINSVQILSFTLGWHGGVSNKSDIKSFSRRPDFIEISIEIGQLNLVPNILKVERAILEIRLDRSNSGYDFSLTSHAGITLGQCAVELFITYGDRQEWFNVYGDDDIPGHLKLSLNTTHSGSLSLSNILGHFMPNIQCLPPAFQTILTKTGITKFRLGVEEDDSGKNSISMLDLEIVLEEDDINVFEGLSISKPQFNLCITRPNDEDQRSISASISLMTTIDDEDIKATIWLDAGEDTIVGVTLFPTGDAIQLGDIISFFGQKLSESLNLPIPKELSYLEEITAGPIYLSFRKSSDESFKLDSLFIAVEADRDFVLWDSPLVEFSNIKFVANYIRGSGMHVGFGISLALGSYELAGSLSYDHAYHDLANVDELQKLDGTSTKAMTVRTEFKGELSLHELLFNLTGVNIKEVLGHTQLESITKYTDIRIYAVDLTLSKTSSTWAIKLTADLEWLAFNSISLEAFRANSWAFNLRLECKDGPLKLLPDSWASEIQEYVDFGDTLIYFFYGPMKDSLGKQQLTLSKNSLSMLQTKGGIAITTSLKFKSKLGLLKEWLEMEDIQVFGAAGPEFFVLGVDLKRLTLFENENISIVGRFLLSYVGGGLSVAIEGDFDLNLSAISDTIISGTVEAGIDLSNGRLALGLKTHHSLKDLCRIKGLDLEAIVIKLLLDPAAEMMPTQFDLHGGIRIEDLDNVSGHLAVRFIAKDPMNCYIEGEIKNLNLLSLLGKFASALRLPQEVQSFLNNNGINFQYLAIQLIPKDMIDITNGKMLKRRFYFEGALSIVINGSPIWAGYTLIDINDSGFDIIALMEPIQLVHEDVFSLKRFHDPGKAQYKLELPNVNRDYLTPRMLNEGPVLKFASKGPDPVFVSAQLTFLGTHHKLFAVAKENSFFATFKTEVLIGSFELSVNCVLNSYIDVIASLTLDLGEQFLQIAAAVGALEGVSGSETFKRQSETSTSVRFSGNLKIGIAWASGKDPLSIELSGRARIFDRDWELGIISVRITEDDLRTLKTLASRLWEYIKDQFSNLVMTWIRAVETAVKTAITFIEDNWKLAEQELARLVADLKDLPVASVVESVLRELQTTYEDAKKVYEELDFPPFMAIKLLIRIYGENPPPDQRPFDLPDVPAGLLDLPRPARPGGPIGIPIPLDLLHGLPGFDKPLEKPTPAPEPAPSPTIPTTNPFAEIPIRLPFGGSKHESGNFLTGFPNVSIDSNDVSEDVLTALEAEADSMSLEAVPEDSHTRLDQGSKAPVNADMQGIDSKQLRDIVVARLPTWYTNEIEQYLESTSNSTSSHTDAAPVHEVIRQIASFDEEEVINIAKNLRLAGFSDADIQKAYKDSFGQDMLPQVLARV
ncbi:hypothetical protein EYB26_007289 [Talaromyces marneffei]|uniref:uncharacterized protein n=1 Tax=Talaromyces marneffei TaxID=37727 RepID=UPI0012A791D1|nr:uncharacterized protein EYB26_007289 [Talaromyces marneffei]QGA19600.1 hypothetical protein EYB26_007289 [Talaromyces marneffei]